MDLILDVMCGGLVSYLRLCGHDTVYAADRELEADDELRALAREECRTLITRDRELAGRTAESILLGSHDVETQLAALSDAGVDLTPTATPERCGRCNGSLDRVSETETTPEYAPDPESIGVWKCRRCGQLFWRGSHVERMERTLSRVRD